MSEEASLVQPYRHLLEDRDQVEILRSTPNRLTRALGALSTEAIENKPAPGKWSVREILAHLADCEIAWAWRLRLIYGAENPSLEPFNQDAFAVAYDGPGYTADAARATWAAVRRWNLALIDSLTPEQRERPAQHAELGPITLWTVVEIAAGHDLHHLASLEQLVSGSSQA